ncbi:DUF977 family protein [Escherichia coli]|uniref:DUF977 family protein n=1 Tax=Escherichia coli TaxID=562 RepID=UPI001E516810|nr:DUF977 family protein [Escherichia coli]
MKIKHEHIRMAMNAWAHPDGEKVPAAEITRAYFELGMTFPELYPDLIWSLPDGEIRRYDSRLNIICRECRKSEVMQRILSFYQGDVRYLLK